MPKYELPIKYFENNLIFESATRDCWAGYQIDSVGYDYLSNQKKLALLNAITRFVANIGTEAKIHVIPIRQDVKNHYDKIKKDLNSNDNLYEIAVNHADGTLAYLEEQQKINGAGTDYQIFVFTKLRMPQKNVKFKTIVKDTFRMVNEFLEVDLKEIRQSEIDTFSRLSESYFNAQRNRIPLKRINEDTIQWLIRRCFCRGLNEDIILRQGNDNHSWKPFSEIVVKDGQKILRPDKRSLLTLTGEVEQEDRYLKVKDSRRDKDVSYQTFLTISFIPDQIAIPGGEWLYMLQDWPISSEVCITLTAIEFKESRKKLENKEREITSQMEHVLQTDAVPDDLKSAYQEVANLERELAPASDPLVKASFTICVAADNLKEMENNAQFIKERYEDMTFEIQRSVADQYALFIEAFPGTGRYVNDYILPLPPKTVAGSMFCVTNLLGDREGHYIGTFGILKKQVFLNLARACALNRSASAYISGTLGGGKSYLANLLAVLHVLQGAKALIIDPKGDRIRWKEKLPALAQEMTITALTAGNEDRGKLDPFILFKDDINEACELAKNIICDLYDLTSADDEYIVLGEVLQNMSTISQPSMEKFLTVLENFPENDELKKTATKLLRRLRSSKELGMAKLLFSDGNSDGLNFDKRINILTVENLNLPDPETPKAELNEAQRLSMVLMIPIAAFAKRFAMSDRSIFKLVVFDEAWALKNTTSGMALFEFMARMGRALNAGAIFIGHSVTDQESKGIREALTYKFCYKAVDDEEIINALNFIGLETTEENRRLLMNLENGHCLFRDLDGHVGELDVDAVWEDFHNAFNTNPTEQ